MFSKGIWKERFLSEKLHIEQEGKDGERASVEIQHLAPFLSIFFIIILSPVGFNK